MDPKRKKIYIIIIVVCFAGSAGLLIWNGSGTVKVSDQPSLLLVDPTVSRPATRREPSGNSTERFSVPDVFPSSDQFMTEVLELESFTMLQPYTPVDVTGQLGRPDPFRNY